MTYVRPQQRRTPWRDYKSFSSQEITEQRKRLCYTKKEQCDWHNKFNFSPGLGLTPLTALSMLVCIYTAPLAQEDGH